MADAPTLASWNDTATRQAIVAFVESVTDEGHPAYATPDERIAVFDNDGTLWCEKPMPVEVGFILARLAAMAEEDASLRERQPWKAAYEKDYAWLGAAITKHYQGDDSDVRLLLGAIPTAFAGMSVEAYAASAHAFLEAAPHPTLGRRLSDCGYVPMVELLRYLEHHGFTVFIVSGGNRDFMRPVTRRIYGIPPHRVVGSTSGLRYEPDEHGGNVIYEDAMDFFDDGPIKPVRIWSRIGRRPLVAVGNSNGDVEMLQFTGGKDREALRMLVLHDDAEREFDYVSGAERSLEEAKAQGWTVISVKDDWSTVFGEPHPQP